jgi:hypothetical protein
MFGANYTKTSMKGKEELECGMQERRTQFYRRLQEAARTQAEGGSQSEIRSTPEEKTSPEL